MTSGITSDACSSSIFEQLDLISDEFDQDWADGQSPSITEFVNRVENEYRKQLLRLLIPIDVEYRKRNGLELDAQRYESHDSSATKISADAIANLPNVSTHGREDSLPEINGFRLIRRIGQGGMGTVFLAEQSEPVKRLVAVKIIKPVFDSAEVFDRFEGERQALAMMDHPNIARIFEAGSTDNGLPYFTMEWVNGIPIGDYCDQHQLAIDQRIELFLNVCQAVQHAHQKGIIHRDLKPTNILVMHSNGAAVPKVIDFGLAKALSENVRLVDYSKQTRFGSILGTPQYMSPEQASVDPSDVDTRSDIFSLGIILFELITGSTPVESKQLKSKSLLESLEFVRQFKAPRPSARLSTIKNETKQIGSDRKTSLKRLSQSLKGDLDWIVMHALDADRDRRYETVEAFQDDLRRYLAGDPVHARPPATFYVFRKTAQKYKYSLSAALAFVLLMAATSLVITKLYFNEKAARIEAEQQIARAKYFRALGFWARNRTREATQALDKIDPRYRFIECRLAKNQFKGSDVTILDGQGNSLYDAALSPDGKWIASLASEDLLLVMDAASGEVVKRIEAEDTNDHFRLLAFHPSNQQVAVGGKGKIQIWNIESSTLARELLCPDISVRALRFSHDGTLLAAAGGGPPDSTTSKQDPAIRLWNLNRRERPRLLKGHTASINSLSFNADGTRLASASFDKTLRIWDTNTGGEVLQKSISSYVMCVEFNPSGDSIACGAANNQLTYWQYEQDELVLGWQHATSKFEGDTVECLAFSGDGKKLAIGGFSRSVNIWDVENGNEIETLRGHFETVVRVGFGQNSNDLFSASADRVIKRWNLERQSESRILKGHKQSVTAISFSGDSQWLVSSGGDHEFDTGPSSPSNSKTRVTDNSIRMWNLGDGSSNTFCGHADSVYDVEFDTAFKNGTRFASCGADGMICLWQRDLATPISTFAGHSGQPVNAIAFPTSGGIFASVGDDSFVRVWDATSQSELSSHREHESPVRHVAWNQKGNHIASIGGKGSNAEVIVWDWREKRILWKKRIPGANSLAFSADGKTLGVAGNDLSIFDAAIGTTIRNLTHSRLGLYFVAFYSDKNEPRLLTGGREGHVWFWDSDTWEELSVLKIKGAIDWNFVYDGKFSPDGRMIATANRDGTIRVWDANNDDD